MKLNVVITTFLYVLKNIKFVNLVLEHINYIKEKVGVSGVGIGAEFDASNETYVQNNLNCILFH